MISAIFISVRVKPNSNIVSPPSVPQSTNIVISPSLSPSTSTVVSKKLNFKQ